MAGWVTGGCRAGGFADDDWHTADCEIETLTARRCPGPRPTHHLLGFRLFSGFPSEGRQTVQGATASGFGFASAGVGFASAAAIGLNPGDQVQ
jgi:hypothetical protein